MDPNKPVYMLNVLWFKPDGGAEKYREYMQAVAPLIAKSGAKVVPNILIPGSPIIGEFDADMVFFVEYPNIAVFQQFATSAEYQPLGAMREAALTKSLLIPCQPLGG